MLDIYTHTVLDYLRVQDIYIYSHIRLSKSAGYLHIYQYTCTRLSKRFGYLYTNIQDYLREQDINILT